ncbi:MAG: glycosyltransferase, exosortase A system-associated [Gammaproteobacteria bacterium]|nr:glycosyltransferase, exosortase A system-associated [Gammaproteobacteria bacterium]
MRILHILDHSIPLHSGYTFRTRNILQEQRALGWETVHVTGSKHLNPAGQEEDVEGFHFYRTQASEGFLDRLPVLNQLAVVNTLSARLEEVVEKESPDILHAHSPSLNGLAALRIGRRHRIPVVYECRAFWEDAAVDHGTSSEWGLRYRLTRALETRVFKQANAVTTICEGLRRDILARGIPPERVTVIPNAVDIGRFNTDRQVDPELVLRLGLEGTQVLGFIGSFYAYEGLSLLIEAMPRVLAQMPDVRLLLVGGGPQEDALHQQADELGVGDRIVFTGRVPHDQVQKYYDLVDILVYPRLPMRLTELVTPLKPLEAMAQGRIVLASDVGGHKELIRDGENGTLFCAGDSESLVESILMILQHPDEWPRMQSCGREFVERERNWPASVAGYKTVYERLV